MDGQDSWSVFQGCKGPWVVGCWLARRLHPAQGPRTAMDLGVAKFYFYCVTCGLEKLGRFVQNRLERDFSYLLLRTLGVGRQQESESIEAALDVTV